MYCSKCGSKLEINDKFCIECESAVISNNQYPVEAIPPKNQVDNGTGKQFSRGVFVAFILVSTYAAAVIFSEKGIGTILFSALIAETFAFTAVGFSIAKLITKNERRTWVEIALFQVFNVVGGFISISAGQMKAIFAILSTFLLSMLLFWLQKKSRSESEQ